jgi:putative flippase GtrA
MVETPGGRGKLSLVATLSRFSLVGIAATGTYFVVANALMMLSDAPAQIASVVAYIAGMLVSFLGQSRLTFLVREHSWRHVIRFCVLSAAGLATSYFTVVWAEALNYPPFWATVATSIAIPVLSFAVMKFWVFAEPGSSDMSRTG